MLGASFCGVLCQAVRIEARLISPLVAIVKTPFHYEVVVVPL